MYDVIICGGGPAGLTAALYTARRNLKTLVVSEDIGGQTNLALEIENYPGIEKVSGIDLANIMKKQAESFGTEFKTAKIIGMELQGEAKKIKTNEGDFEGKTVIIATGAKHRTLGVAGEEKLIGKGVSYCATCDGPMFRGKKVAVVGGGDAALVAAIFLADICEKVYIVHRRDSFRAEEANVKLIDEKNNIEKIWDSEAVEFIGEPMLEKIKIKNKKTEEVSELEVAGCFIEVGFVPSTAIAHAGGVELHEDGHIKVDAGMKTGVDGVFAAGDVTGHLAQITVAVGEGAIAGTNAYFYIVKPEYKTPDYH